MSDGLYLLRDLFALSISMLGVALWGQNWKYLVAILIQHGKGSERPGFHPDEGLDHSGFSHIAVVMPGLVHLRLIFSAELWPFEGRDALSQCGVSECILIGSRRVLG